MAKRFGLRNQPRHPYHMILLEESADGRIREHGFRLSPIGWGGQGVNQRSPRFSAGEQTIHDFSLLNVQAYTDLYRGGTGATTTEDGTRYQQALNVVCQDEGEIKLAPATVAIATGVIPSGWKIVHIIPWMGYTASGPTLGANDPLVVVVATNGTNTRFYTLAVVSQSIEAATSLITLQVNTGTTTNEEVGRVLSAQVFRNKLYFSCPGQPLRYLVYDAALGYGSKIKTVTVGGSPMAETIYGDSQYFYLAQGNALVRTADPSVPSPVWSDPVLVGEAAPITGIVTYGSEEARAVFCTTWYGLWRILEERDTSGNATIKTAFPADVRIGMADDDTGKMLCVINNEVVFNLPGTLARHTIGQTNITSPWDNNGTPIEDRGRIVKLQDTRGGIAVAVTPYNLSVGKSVVYRWVQGKWHEFLLLPQGTELTTLAWTTRQIASSARLWIAGMLGTQATLVYSRMPTSTTNYRELPGQTYVTSGTLVLPPYITQYKYLDKLWHNVQVQFNPRFTGVMDVRVDADTGNGFATMGAYSPVPMVPPSPSSALRRWVGVSQGGSDRQSYSGVFNGVQLGQVVSKSIQLRLVFEKRQYDIGAYPELPFDAPQLLLGMDRLFAYGAYIDGRTSAPSLSSLYARMSIAVWDLAMWKFFDVQATSIVGSARLSDGRVLIGGNLYGANGVAYSVMLLDPYDQSAVGLWELTDGETVSGFSFHTTGGVVVVATSVSGATTLRRATWATGATSVSDITVIAQGLSYVVHDLQAASATHSLLLTSSPTGVGVKSYTSTTHLLQDVVQSGGTATSTQIRNARRVVVDALGMTWLLDRVGRTLILLDPVTLVSATYTAIAIPETLGVDGLFAHGGSAFVGVGNALYQYTAATATWTQLAVGSVSETILSIASLDGQAGLFVSTTARRGSTFRQVCWLYRTEPAQRGTPVIENVGLYFLELPDELRAYTVTILLADEQEDLNGQPDPRSAEQQLQNLLRLYHLKRVFPVIMPDGTRMEALLSGPNWRQTKGDVVRYDNVATDNVAYEVSLTIQETTHRPGG